MASLEHGGTRLTGSRAGHGQTSVQNNRQAAMNANYVKGAHRVINMIYIKELIFKLSCIVDLTPNIAARIEFR
jgi:hypothetical protein